MKTWLWLVALALLLTGCTGEKGIVDRESYQLDTRHQAQAAYPRIKVLVIHYTADDFDGSLVTLTDKNVSSHYLIPAVPPLHRGKPRIWQLVPEQDLAWHAGISFWRGATRINDTSIGIELENRGWQKSAGEKYFAPFEPATTSSRRTWLRMRTSPRSEKTTPVRCFPGRRWQSRVLAPGLMRSG